MEKKIYYYDEIIRWIEEENITIWDLALKLDLSISSPAPLQKLLNKICDGNSLKAKRLIEKLKKNSKEYADNNIDKSKKLNFNTLVYMANNGYSSTEVMKEYGFYDYQYYSISTTKMLNEEKIEKSNLKQVKSKIKNNRKHLDVEVLSRSEAIHSLDEKEESSVEVEEVSIAHKNESNTTLLPCEVITKVASEKIVIYSYEYLKFSDFSNELECFEEEKIILSETLNKFMSDREISDNKKFILSNAINDPRINLRILIAMSNYENKKNEINLTCENDLLLSQALMLSEYTDKDIYIAVQNNLTAINTLVLGFGLRLSKRFVQNLVYLFKDDDLSYFDYIIKDNSLDYLRGKDAYILDTCVIIGGTPERVEKRNYMYQSKEYEKLIPYIVLKELTRFDTFIGLLYVAKNNPTFKLILDLPLIYNYNDIAILNTAMYLKRKFNLNATLLTYDFRLNMEALQYNFKSIYYDAWWEKIKEEKEIVENNETNSANIEDKNFYKTQAFMKIHSEYVLLNDNTLEKVMDQNRKVLGLIGHKGFKYYKVEIGSLIRFRNDPCLYSIRSFEGTNNLVAV